jgi:predicted permease
MKTLRQDLLYSLRMLLKSPGFTLAAALALGLAIGANTAIFSIFNGMLWRPLPVDHPENLVVLTEKAPKFEFPFNMSYADYQDYKKLGRVFSDLAVYAPSPVNFNAQGGSERAWAEFVGGNYFSMLGVNAVRGRTFAPDEGLVPGKDLVVVLSYHYWQRRFGSDPDVIGNTVEINRHAFTIIGVAPESFHGTYYFLDPDFYVPATTISVIDPTYKDALERRDAFGFSVIGRLAPGVTPEQAEAAAEPVDDRLAHDFPDSHSGVALRVDPELRARPEPGIGSFMPKIVAALMTLVGLVLLIACANVANLILARANARRKEIAIRTALGASRWRMIRQLLTESILISLVGGIAGLFVARAAAVGLLSIRVPGDIPLRLFDLRMDWRIFIFCLAAALFTGFIAGLVPAIQTSRTDLAETLKEGGRSAGAGTGRHRLRNLLVVSQLTVSLVLLACTGFFLRSLQNSANVDMGFRPDHTLMLSVDLGLQGYDQKRGEEFYRQLIDRVKNLRGVRNASVSAYIPMGYDTDLVNVFPGDRLPSDKSDTETSIINYVQQDYFDTMGVPVIRGREFTVGDTATSPLVAIINQAFADKIWPEQNPLGKTFRTKKDGPLLQVVGMTRTGKYLFLYENPRPCAYVPLAQHYVSSATIEVYSQGDPLSLVNPVREQIRELDSTLPVFGILTIQEHVRYGKPLLPARLGAILVGSFGILGLALATIGVYGVVSYSVSQQTQEIGIRMALGAQRSNVISLVVRQGTNLALIGMSIGLLLAIALARALRAVLFGVSGVDFLVLLTVSALLFFVALVASYVPARRATRVDPLVALRYE